MRRHEVVNAMMGLKALLTASSLRFFVCQGYLYLFRVEHGTWASVVAFELGLCDVCQMWILFLKVDYLIFHLSWYLSPGLSCTDITDDEWLLNLSTQLMMGFFR